MAVDESQTRSASIMKPTAVMTAATITGRGPPAAHRRDHRVGEKTGQGMIWTRTRRADGSGAPTLALGPVVDLVGALGEEEQAAENQHEVAAGMSWPDDEQGPGQADHHDREKGGRCVRSWRGEADEPGPGRWSRERPPVSVKDQVVDAEHSLQHGRVTNPIHAWGSAGQSMASPSSRKKRPFSFYGNGAVRPTCGRPPPSRRTATRLPRGVRPCA